MNRQNRDNAINQNNGLSQIYLLTGTILSIFSIGKWNIPITIYIWPFCFLHYLHINDNKVFSLLKVYVCILIANLIRWIGCSNLNLNYDLLAGFYFSINTLIPYLVDLIFYKRVPKWKSIFIFPLTVSLTEFVLSFYSFSNNNLYAYSQLDNISFLQIISLFGTFFLSFIITLFASILDYSINIYLKESKISKFVYYYIGINLLIYLYGGILLLIPYNKETIRAVSVRGISQEYYVFKKNDILPLETYYNYINDTMTKAKNINADFISYAERAFAFNEEDKDEFINKAINYVKFFKINTLISLDIRYKRNEVRSKQNMNIFIDDKGKILYQYTKHNLIPFVEFDYFPSKEPLQAINTKLGKMSTVICYDINYPLFINSLSRNHLDMLIVPSWDYPGVAEFQSKEARYKAIEGGFNLIKNTANGVVIASDYKGRILSYFSGENCQDYFIVSELYKHGVKTLYSYIGRFFNFIYLISLIFVIYYPDEEDDIKQLKIKKN